MGTVFNPFTGTLDKITGKNEHILEIEGDTSTPVIKLKNGTTEVLNIKLGSYSAVLDVVSEEPTNLATNGGFETDLEGWEGTPELSWKLSQRLGTETQVRSLVSLGNGIVIAGTAATGQIYRSTDSGENWSYVQRLGSETYVVSLTSLGNGIALAGTTGGNVYRSTNSGENWSLVEKLGSEQHVLSLTSLGNGIALAGTHPTGQVWRSTDSGENWSLVQRLGSETHVLSLTSLGNGIVIAGTHKTGQIYRSTNSGATWSLVGQLGSETHVLSLASLGNGIVIAGTSGGNVYRSTNSGENWSLVQRLGSETYVFSLTSLGNGIVIAGTYPRGQIYRSTDSGESWSLVERLGSETYVFSLTSLGNGIVIAGTASTGQIWSTGINAERITTIKYSGTASAKIVASSTGPFTQSVNVGNTNSYTVSTYAYTNGSAITSADLELYYNGSAISTVYTSVGSGWYLLSATITGANESRTYGVEVKAGKTVYIDSFAITAGSGASTKLYITNSGTGEASLDVETDIKGQDIEAREITGSGRKKGIAIKTEAYTLTQTDDIVICDSDTAFTVTLPEATGDGQVFTIKNVNTATITIDGDGGTIDGNATLPLLEDESLTIADYDTNSWIIL